MSRIRSKLTFANVTSMMALLVALSGTALALQNNSVKSRHIADGHVRAADIGSFRVETDTSEVISGGVAHNGAYTTGSARADCANGETAITGGAGWTLSPADAEETFISASHPIGFTNTRFLGWEAKGGNDSGVDNYLIAYVICLRAGP